MLLHVSYNLVDRFQHRYIATLRRDPLNQPLRGQGSNHSTRFLHCLLEKLRQCCASYPTIRAELSIANPNILRSTDSMHHPLPHIPTQMQYEVPHGIFMRPMPLPHLRICKLSQTGAHILHHRVQLVARIFQKVSRNLLLNT